jgi:outer membrane protein OmpA-like peptidoglycan-associated protein
MRMPEKTGKRATAAGVLFWAAAVQMGCVATAQEQQPGLGMPAGQPTATASATPDIQTSAVGQSILVLNFAEGRSILSAEARRALDRAAPHMIGHMAEGGLVIVLGSYDPADRPDEIPALAARRAEAVTTYLHEAWGIDPRRLQLRHRAAHPNMRAQTDDHARRVEVFLVPGQGSDSRMTASLPLSLRVDSGHLDLDDFGGAENPLLARHRQ